MKVRIAPVGTTENRAFPTLSSKTSGILPENSETKLKKFSGKLK